MTLFPADWLSVFAPETPLLELVARNAILYVGLLALVRVMPRRAGGKLGTMDLVFVLLITEAAAHSSGDYTSVADGLITIVTLMGLNWLVNSLSYYVPAIEWLVSAPPTHVIRDGKLLRRSMRGEYLTHEELMSHLRKGGIEHVEDVRSACIESDGSITVIAASE